MAATSTDTAVRYFIAVIGDQDAVYGIGESADQAIEDARSNGDASEPLAFVAQECTKRLYDYVEENGSHVSWTVSKAGLQDLSDYAEFCVFEGIDGSKYRFSAEDRADAARKAVLSLDGYAYGTDAEGEPLVIELTASEIEAKVRALVEGLRDAATWDDCAEAIDAHINAIARENGCDLRLDVTYQGQTDRLYSHEAD